MYTHTYVPGVEFMRLDKYLTQLNIGSRSQVKDLIKKGLVTVNGQTEKSPERKIDEMIDVIICQGQTLSYQDKVYYMFHKPAGCVSATEDRRDITVIDFLKKENRKDIFPVGRLDKDTEGLLIITNDGDLAHRLLSPVKHVEKCYLARLAHKITQDEILRIEQGLDIGEEKPTRPARFAWHTEADRDSDTPEALLTITEGKYHQVKRMFRAVGNEVTYLKRLSMGSLTLDDRLKPGEYRPLTDIELETLKGELYASGKTGDSI